MTLFGGHYRGRRVLVTGHTGFKGSWLTLWLEHLGAEVGGLSIDVPDPRGGFHVFGMERRIAHYREDIRDRQQVARVIDDFRPDTIFHLAAQPLVRAAYDDPVTTFETNVLGMLNLLECVRTRPSVEALVLITSDKVYRNDEWCWGYRETDALGGHDPYGGSKACAELVASSYYRSFYASLPTRMATARAGNVIGGGDWAVDRIVPDCIRAWSRGESVGVRNPSATRPWQHVLEPLSGYLWLGAQLCATPVLSGESFNFGPDASVAQTVGDLLTSMAARWPGARWHTTASTGGREAGLLKLSCDKALFHLGWRAVLQFNDTVDWTVAWYRGAVEGTSDVRELSLDHIRRYSDRAASLDLPWARRGGPVPAPV